MKAELARGHVSGEHYRGRWFDIGTPERLAALVERYAHGVGPDTRPTVAGTELRHADGRRLDVALDPVHADPLRPAGPVGRGVRADGEPLGEEQRFGPADDARLPVRPDHVDRAQPELGPWVEGSRTVGTDWQPPVLEGWEPPEGH